MRLTPEILTAALHIPQQRAALWAPAIAQACEMAQINTISRMAAFLGQIGHESGRLRYVREIWGPTRQQARYEPTTKLSRKLGNVRPGDGRRYMGRGLIQVTGRANYVAFTARIRARAGESAPDFVAAPALLEDPHWAAMSAADYWITHGLNRWADAGDTYTLTRRINGGTNGLADRQALTASAMGHLIAQERVA